MSWVARNRATLLIVLGLLLGVIVTTWVSGGAQEYAGRLDPQNSAPNGARALAQVLGDQGVEVQIVRGADELDAADVERATVLVTSTDQLGRSTARRLRAHAAGAQVLVVEAGPEVVDLLGASANPITTFPSGPVSAQCANTRLSGLSIEVDRADAYEPVDGACFPQPEDGVLYAPHSEGLALFGAGDALSNAEITRADNAAVALRLLGRGDRLVWYVPSVTDLASGDEVGLGTLLPRWLTPSLWLGGLVLIALALWRGRRLGGLVTEPLPVLVKAIETTQSRGRLYRRSRDRHHAASVLREAARGRAADRLRLPRTTDQQQLFEEVARHTGLPVSDVSGRLSHLGTSPANDNDLNELAGQLADLDEQLRKAPR